MVWIAQRRSSVPAELRSRRPGWRTGVGEGKGEGARPQRGVGVGTGFRERGTHTQGIMPKVEEMPSTPIVDAKHTDKRIPYLPRWVHVTRTPDASSWNCPLPTLSYFSLCPCPSLSSQPWLYPPLFLVHHLLPRRAPPHPQLPTPPPPHPTSDRCLPRWQHCAQPLLQSHSPSMQIDRCPAVAGSTGRADTQRWP